MNKARIAVLLVALAAGGGAMYMMSGPAPQQPAPTIVQAPAAIDLDRVLVAARELPVGAVIGENDIVWQEWPKSALSPAMMRIEGDGARVVEDVKNSVARQTILQGEPIRREKIVKGPNSGYMSAILPSGMRAVAINIDNQGGNTAGGFILPNDRVDVIRIYRDDAESKARGVDVFASETILSNIRVLAIGQTVREKNGEPVVVGANATLELDPRQAELVVVAQRVGAGNLTLVLRSMLDSNRQPEVVQETDNKGLTIVRYGLSSQQR